MGLGMLVGTADRSGPGWGFFTSVGAAASFRLKAEEATRKKEINFNNVGLVASAFRRRIRAPGLVASAFRRKTRNARCYGDGAACCTNSATV